MVIFEKFKNRTLFTIYAESLLFVVMQNKKMKRKVKLNIFFLPLLAAAILIQSFSCSSAGPDNSETNRARMIAEKPEVDTSKIPELIELYRAPRYESIQEALLAGPENVLKMSFHGKKIGSLSPEIEQFPYLASLDVANNDLSSLPAEISNLHYLQGFYANGNRLDHFPEVLFLLPLLDRVDLSGNQISTLPVEIMKMDQLASLSLEENLLTGIPVQLYELDHLEVLNLAKNGLYKIPEGIGHLKNLRKLDLANNQLTSLPRELASLSGTLKEMNIQGNPIPRDQIDWFIEAMPSTGIRF